MAKVRTQISNDLATDVMFASDRTCCVCRVRGKAVQIHHIDENPSNNVFENLSVLCLECHNETQSKGGFHRKLNPNLIVKYRDEWIDRVRSRRNIADERAIKMQVGEQSLSQQVERPSKSLPKHTEFKDPPIAYINALPAFKAALLAPTKLGGSTLAMGQSFNDYIDSITGILVTLSNYYSKKQFGNQSPEEYFSEIISSRFRWHTIIAEPNGPGTGGTIVSIIVGRSVMADLEKMVEDMVSALIGFDDSFDLDSWVKRWRDH